jgi:hypothetical protein
MNAEAAEFAAAALPGIHFANIVRNGIEVVASRMVHRVLGQHSFEEQCLAWAASVDMARWGKPRNDFTLIRHEQLLDRGGCQQAMQLLQRHAGLPESDSIASYLLSEYRNQTTYESETADQAANLSRRGERWHVWTSVQRSIFEDICGTAMRYFGYRIPWQES